MYKKSIIYLKCSHTESMTLEILANQNTKIERTKKIFYIFEIFISDI